MTLEFNPLMGSVSYPSLPALPYQSDHNECLPFTGSLKLIDTQKSLTIVSELILFLLQTGDENVLDCTIFRTLTDVQTI